MTTPTHTNSHTHKNQKSFWLVATVIMAVFALVMWVISAVVLANKQKQTNQIENEQIVEDTGEVSQVNLVQSIENLHELADDVAPIGYDTVIRDVNSYPEEFKDSKYLTRYKGKWTLQVMTVNEHDIIKDYLETRDDRENFAYFRYLDAADQKKYVLTYGVMADAQEAANMIGQVDFGLPSNISILPVEIKRYIKRIDNYERAEALVDLASGQREIKLVPTRRQVPARSIAPKTVLNTDNSDNQLPDSTTQSEIAESAEQAQVDAVTNTDKTVEAEDSTPFQPSDNVPVTAAKEESETEKAPVQSETNDAIEQKIEQIAQQKPVAESSIEPTPEVEPAPKPFIPDEAP